MPFQTQVYLTQSPAVEGDFASANPRHANLTPGEGTFVAGNGGVTIGRFAWADANGKLTNAGSGAPTGFVHRELTALITAFLAEASMVIPQGLPVGGLFNGGDFWARNAGAGAVTIGQKAFASNTTGAVSFANAGATVTGSTETRFYAASAATAGELVKISSLPPTA